MGRCLQPGARCRYFRRVAWRVGERSRAGRRGPAPPSGATCKKTQKGKSALRRDVRQRLGRFRSLCDAHRCSACGRPHPQPSHRELGDAHDKSSRVSASSRADTSITTQRGSACSSGLPDFYPIVYTFCLHHVFSTTPEGCISHSDRRMASKLAAWSKQAASARSTSGEKSIPGVSMMGRGQAVRRGTLDPVFEG